MKHCIKIVCSHESQLRHVHCISARSGQVSGQVRVRSLLSGMIQFICLRKGSRTDLSGQICQDGFVRTDLSGQICPDSSVRTDLSRQVRLVSVVGTGAIQSALSGQVSGCCPDWAFCSVRSFCPGQRVLSGLLVHASIT